MRQNIRRLSYTKKRKIDGKKKKKKKKKKKRKMNQQNKYNIKKTQLSFNIQSGLI